jgi:protein-disulfide isomerase
MPRHLLERKLRRARTLNIALGAVAIAGVLFAGFQWGAANTTSPSADAGDVSAAADSGSGANAQAAVSHVRREADDPMAIGAIDAPVVLSEWVDFRCPYCAVFSRDVFPQLVQEYVDAGKVRIEMHDVAFFGEESVRAAVAARAAGEQGKYFEFLAAVYAAAPEGGHPDLLPEELIEFAEIAGVPDLAQFKSGMQRDDLKAAVQQSTEQAQQLGVTGVPFFAVGDQAFSGAQPLESFRDFLDQQLAQSGS